MSNKIKVEPVKKNTAPGSWHGRDAWKLALKRFLAILAICAVFFLASLMLYFDLAWVQIISALIIITLVMYQQFFSGASLGERDASLGEIVYDKLQEGKEVTKDEKDHCFHWFKGIFATLIGCLPFVVLCIVYAFMAKEQTFTLGALPNWTESLRAGTGMGDALHYYQYDGGMTLETILRVADRIMVMPFLNLFNAVNANASLLVERLSPILVLICPMSYGIGYATGLKQRTKVNTSIKIGDEKKKRKARREKKKRTQQRQPKKPEQLI